MNDTIGNPLSWSAREARRRGQATGVDRDPHRPRHRPSRDPGVRRITVHDLRDVLREGVEDFAACRTDVIALCLFYPVIGRAPRLDRLRPQPGAAALSGDLGVRADRPGRGVGLYEMSRLREQGEEPSWGHAFAVVKHPSFAAIAALGLLLGGVFVVWMLAANGIYYATLGPEPPASFGAFSRDVFTTGAGWVMIIVGCAVGFLFAALVLASSVVAFPLLLDRDVGVPVAVITSLRVAAANPVPIAVWGLIVTAGLVIGAIPFFLGLIVVMPILGHATWHLYRRTVVEPDTEQRVE